MASPCSLSKLILQFLVQSLLLENSYCWVCKISASSHLLLPIVISHFPYYFHCYQRVVTASCVKSPPSVTASHWSLPTVIPQMTQILYDINHCLRTTVTAYTDSHWQLPKVISHFPCYQSWLSESSHCKLYKIAVSSHGQSLLTANMDSSRFSPVTVFGKQLRLAV